jgi:cellulose synthase/poly-beta-1,6-N-acetylglucosamine synthase-like glycosyltransferase
MLIIVIVGFSGVLLEFLSKEALLTPDTSFDSIVLFKYFTIQTNILVVVYFSAMLTMKQSFQNSIFKNFIGGVTLCITVTFTMFLFFLESNWDPQGLSALSSIIMHYISPVLVISFFTAHIKEYTFRTIDIFYWAIYPIFYVLFILVFGSITSDYIYPFFNLNELGILRVVLTIFVLILGYEGLSFLIVKIVSQNNDEKMKK